MTVKPCVSIPNTERQRREAMAAEMIDELSGLLGDTIDTTLDDFRDKLHRRGQTITLDAYRSLVEEAVYRASGHTVFLLGDDQYLDGLALDRS